MRCIESGVRAVQPFPSKNGYMAFSGVLEGERPQLEDYPCEVFKAFPCLWDLFQSCWKQIPDERPKVADVLTRLSAMLSTFDESSYPEAEPRKK